MSTEQIRHAEATAAVERKGYWAGTDSTDEEANEPVPHVHAKTLLAVFGICMIYFAQGLSIVGAGVQGNVISAHFNSSKDVTWMTAPITILSVALGPVVSQASDLWGRKWFLVILTTFGGIGCLITARASSMGMVIGGAAVIGMAFAAQCLLHAVAAEVLPRRWRAWGQGIIFNSHGLGGVLSLMLSGALNRTNNPASEGFRKYYYITTGLFLLAALIFSVVYNPPLRPLQTQLNTKEKLARLDWIGYFFLSAGVVLFSMALMWSKNPYEWSDAHVSATFAVGIVLLICLAVYETYFKKDGMFHHALFDQNRNYAIATICVFAEGVGFFAMNLYFAFEVSTLYETDGLLVNVRYALVTMTSWFGAAFVGWYCAVTKQVRWVSVGSLVLYVVFFICMATTNKDTDKPVWGYPVIGGVAMGAVLTVLITVAQISTPPELIAIASGLNLSVRSLGGTIGIAIYTALFNSEMGHMGANIAKAVIPEGFPQQNLGQLIGALNSHNPAAVQTVPGVTAIIIEKATAALLDTYVSAFRHVWIAGACFMAVAAIIAVFLMDRKGEFNMHIDAPVEKEEDLYSH